MTAPTGCACVYHTGGPADHDHGHRDAAEALVDFGPRDIEMCLPCAQWWHERHPEITFEAVS